MRWLVSGPPLACLVVLFALPSLIMVVASFRLPGEFGGLAPLVGGTGKLALTLDNYARMGEEFLYIRLFIKSASYAVLTTFACLVMAYPLALLISGSPGRFKNFLMLLVVLPFWSSFLIRIYAWMIILGPQSLFSRLVNGLLGGFGVGPVALLFSPVAVLVGLIYVHLPYMVLPLYANLEKHDASLLDAARDLGAGPWRTFWYVTFPLSLPGVYAGCALVFIPAFGIFAIPDLLGGTEGIMVGNLIKQQFLETRDWPFGSALSMALTAIAIVIAGLFARVAHPRGAH